MRRHTHSRFPFIAMAVAITVCALAGCRKQTAPECTRLIECCRGLNANPATARLSVVERACGPDNSTMSGSFCQTEWGNMLSSLPPQITRPAECGVGN